MFAEMLADQIISLAWIRCLQEEGCDFVNKQTGNIEKDELIIYKALEDKSNLFDVPSAKASHWGFEKNILEVYGSYCLFNTDEKILSYLYSNDLKASLQSKIKKIKEGKKRG
jgi:hypothetical protein